jgi:hypothetical protein
LVFFSMIQIFSYLKKSVKLNALKLAFAGVNLLMIWYLFVLSTNMGIYYFDAPFQHYSSLAVSMSSYIPFIILILIFPFSLFTLLYQKCHKIGSWMNVLLLSNYLIYWLLIFSFSYWGLFQVFH